MTPLLLCVLGLILDQYPGKAPQIQPAAAFARLAESLRDSLHTGDHRSGGMQMLLGLLGLLLLTIPIATLAILLAAIPYTGIIADLAVLFMALDTRSLRQTLIVVERHLQANELDEARASLAMLTPQDVHAMDPEGLSNLAVELTLGSALERLFGVIFWFLLAGAGGVAIYWTVRQLDHCWGYTNPRYRYFGRAAARLDDLLNWPAAQLTALSYLLVGRHRGAAWRCWQWQRRCWKSPVGAVLLATGGAALGLQLGGSTRYFGHPVDRPSLGEGLLPRPADIRRARHLLYRVLVLWLGIALLILLPWHWLLA